jgi:hypothetical protein
MRAAAFAAAAAAGPSTTTTTTADAAEDGPCDPAANADAESPEAAAAGLRHIGLQCKANGKHADS